jgi:hypothetical protein
VSTQWLKHVIYISCSLQSTWNKPNRPSTEINAHIAGQDEAKTASTDIGKLLNNSNYQLTVSAIGGLMSSSKQKAIIFFHLKIILP